MTKPWKSTLVPQCSIGYTDQLYSRWRGLPWGMCIRRQHSLGPSWGLATTMTHSPARRTVLPPDVSTTHTLITSRSLLKSYFTGEAFPKLSLRMESLSPFSLLFFYFSLLHLEHLTCCTLLCRQFVMIACKFHVCKI